MDNFYRFSDIDAFAQTAGFARIFHDASQNGVPCSFKFSGSFLVALQFDPCFPVSVGYQRKPNTDENTNDSCDRIDNEFGNPGIHYDSSCSVDVG